LTSASPSSSFLDLADDATSDHRNFKPNTALGNKATSSLLLWVKLCQDSQPKGGRIMLPESRTKEDLFSIPKFTVEKKDVEGFIQELRGYHELFRDCFAREEPRENFFRYIEQCFEETKTELGMDQYEVRKYPGWNHHILTCILAHFFLWHIKIKLGKKAPAITLSQLRILFEIVLPLRKYDAEMALELVQWIQEKNHRAYLSHRKKRLHELDYKIK